MEIKKLQLKNFRNYDNLEIEFSDKLNIIYGNNAAGKSNLVEAIYLLALTKSFRTSNEQHLIFNGNKIASVKGIVKKSSDISSYEVSLSKEDKNVFVNSNKVKKISNYISLINVVLFNPLDTKVISDAPSERRRLLNIAISQINKEYLLLLNDYNKILKNRNAYLKQVYLNANASKEYLDILTKKLIDLGLKISHIRRDYIDQINSYIVDIYKNIFESGNLHVKYISKYDNKDEKSLYDLYRKNYRKEMEFGKTLIGIHHDDIDFILDDNSIREYGSVGQQKNTIISFKLSEINIIYNVTNDYPLLILDDLFSELDNQKVNNIISMLNKEVQTFITTTNIDKIDDNLLSESTIFKVTNGTVERKIENEK